METETAKGNTKVLGQWIAMGELQESKGNPRKRFDKQKLEELAQSIREKGVLEPLLVRPLREGNGEGGKRKGESEGARERSSAQGEYIIVAGARRYRAGKMAELAELPCIVKDLSEAEALELSVIENDQRDDVHPLEQGLGYRALLKAHNTEAQWLGARGQGPGKGEGEDTRQKTARKEGAGAALDAAGLKTRPARAPRTAVKWDVGMLAAKIGKSASFVYQRLQLAELIEPAQTAFLEKEEVFSVSHAILLARLQPAEQKRALSFVLGENAGVRNTAHWIRENVHLLLSRASFPTDDQGEIKSSDLVAGAVACLVCPKRTGAQPELFADIKEQDICTDPGCFHAKEKAFIELQLAGEPAVEEEKGKGKREKGNDAPPAKRVKLSVGDFRYGKKPQGLTGWTAIKGETGCKDTVTGVVAEIGESYYAEASKRKLGEVLDVCTNSNCKVHHEAEPSYGGGSSYAKSPSVKAAERKRKLELEVRARIFQAMQNATSPKTLDEEQLARIVTRLLRQMRNDEEQRLLKVAPEVPRTNPQYGHGMPSVKAEQLVERLDGCGLRHWAVLAAAAYDLQIMPGTRPDPQAALFALAKSLGVKAEKVRKEVEGEAAAKKKAKAPAGKAAGKEVSTSRAERKC